MMRMRVDAARRGGARLALGASPLLLTATLMHPAPAWGYLCSRVVDKDGAPSGPSISWFHRNIEYTLNDAGTDQIDRQTTFDVLEQSFRAWQDLDAGSPTACQTEKAIGTDLSFQQTPRSSSTTLGFNFLSDAHNENLLVFRDEAWAYSALLGPNTVALTTTTYATSTGEILDADIEFNTNAFRFSADGSQHAMDLMNTTVHEIGHFLGLDHVPDPQATMYESAPMGQTSKRNLACDEVAAIVMKYPAGAENGYCDPAAGICVGDCMPPGDSSYKPIVTAIGHDDGLGGGCRGAPAPLPLFALFVFPWAAAQYRRRRRTSPPF